MTTSADNQELPEGVESALKPGEEFRDTEPNIVRGQREPNPNYDEDAAAARNDAGFGRDSRNNPKTMTSTMTEDPQTGERTPYQKATGGDPPEGTQHHAEQRMQNGADANGESVVAQAPTKPCCAGCQANLGEDGLSKVPPGLRGQ